MKLSTFWRTADHATRKRLLQQLAGEMDSVSAIARELDYGRGQLLRWAKKHAADVELPDGRTKTK